MEHYLEADKSNILFAKLLEKGKAILALWWQ